MCVCELERTDRCCVLHYVNIPKYDSECSEKLAAWQSDTQRTNVGNNSSGSGLLQRPAQRVCLKTKKLARARRNGHADRTDDDDDYDDVDEDDAGPRGATLSVPQLPPATSVTGSSLNICPISPCPTRASTRMNGHSSSSGGGNNVYLRSKQRGATSAKKTSVGSVPQQPPTATPARRKATAPKKHSRFRTTGIVAIGAVGIVLPTAKKQKARAHSHGDVTAATAATLMPTGKTKKGGSTSCFSLLLPIMSTAQRHSKERNAEPVADGGGGGGGGVAKVKKFVRHAKSQMKLLKATKKTAGISSSSTTAAAGKRTTAKKT